MLLLYDFSNHTLGHPINPAMLGGYASHIVDAFRASGTAMHGHLRHESRRAREHSKQKICESARCVPTTVILNPDMRKDKIDPRSVMK